MTRPFKSRSLAAAAVAGISLGLLIPAQAQFWDWGNRPQRQQQQSNNPFGGLFSPGQRYDGRFFGPFDQPPPAPVDYSRAPPPAQKKPEATTSIVVVGDANADWLAYGLEDAFAEKPEIVIVRKHRTDSGLIRYGGREGAEWPQVAREIIAAEKPKFIVMMIGNNDRQLIREKAPPAVRPGQPKQAQQPPAAAPAPSEPADPEQQPEQAEAPPANLTPEQARIAAYGPWEFRSERWELAYIKRVDATIAALKSAGVPVFWVGLASHRGPKASADAAYLNEIYRSRAEKAGIVYVDIWDGFVDEAGRYAPQGPDYEGQIRRLRTGDGVYFTKFGARKLAHYVEREIQRAIVNRGLPVALPIPVEPGAQPTKPGGPAQRPTAGPVVPLTSIAVEREELIGGARAPARAPASDATAARVLTKGEPIAAPTGRADNFAWPRGGNAEPAVAEPAAVPAATPAVAPAAAPPAKKSAAGQGGQAGPNQPNAVQPGAEQKQAPRRTRPTADILRPPLSLQGLFR